MLLALSDYSLLRWRFKLLCVLCVCSRLADYMGDDVKYVITEDNWDDTFDTVSPFTFTFIAWLPGWVVIGVTVGPVTRTALLAYWPSWLKGLVINGASHPADMWSYASPIGCNRRRLKSPLKGMSSHATDLAVYASIFFFFWVVVIGHIGGCRR